MSKIITSAIIGLEGALVEVESDIANGLPGFAIVGLPDASIKESKERVRSAIKNSGFKFPPSKTTINLAPADIKKEGPLYDLPIAVSILVSNGVLPEPKEEIMFLGELALDGNLRKVNGVISCALLAKEKGIKKIILPQENAEEAAIVPGIEAYGADSLRQVVAHLRGEKEILPAEEHVFNFDYESESYDYDFAYVKGQEQAKYALEVAAAGGHNVLLLGPPGSGKSMLAHALPSILPKITFKESLEVSKIYSVCGYLSGTRPIVMRRPFRSPHHTASAVSLIGGGSNPRPGEISLAHRGVLFMDELPEFGRAVLESLRQPLEDGIVTVSRIAGISQFPARFILLAAQNPCPCGYYGDNMHPCKCSPAQILKYSKKVSGPLLDRIDLHVEVPAVPIEELEKRVEGESSKTVRQRVEKCRKIQEERFQNENIFTNSEMNSRQILEHCVLDNEANQKLKDVCNFYSLSARSYYRLLKVSRTIADLEGVENIDKSHVARAAQFRMKNN